MPDETRLVFLCFPFSFIIMIICICAQVPTYPCKVQYVQHSSYDVITSYLTRLDNDSFIDEWY